ncbi:phosphotransferase [Corynebacterium freiburgense]|uniref:phosphotransferase n=1 Tax=Corynebacterium freiburgense TaxID=556548 RepID=UPI0004195A36|nr:phosphotransferase [Corynebacterium freiburgense]WJZ02804.1 Phosphotransferase enzyme family protein [Corynebacterium freiburgense]
MPTLTEIVEIAEELLAQKFGGTHAFQEWEQLGGSGTATVIRARLAPSPFLQQRSVVVKFVPSTGDRIDDAALIREVVSYQFTTSLPEDVRPGPVLLAYDIDRRMLVISDSGDGETFADLLESRDPQQRLQLLRTLGQAIGKMHAGTFHREAHFDILLNRMLNRYPASADIHQLRDTTLTSSIDRGMTLLVSAGVQIPEVVRNFANEAQRRLKSGFHRAFTPFDLSPDNILFSDRTQFLDYEWAGFRDVTFDIACVIAGFPQFISAHPISDEEADAFIFAWVDEVNTAWPNVNNHQRLQARIVTALLGWAFASVAYLYYGSMSQAVAGAADGPSAEETALVTASLDEEFDVLYAVLRDAEDARRDLIETFEALARFASRGADPRFPEVEQFARTVVDRLEQR